jgi:hypothetical protein
MNFMVRSFMFVVGTIAFLAGSVYLIITAIGRCTIFLLNKIVRYNKI